MGFATEGGKVMNLAIVVSRFNFEVTEKLLNGAVTRLQELKISRENIKVVWVPGAVEIPLMAQQFAIQGKVDAIICLGAVIKGETDHYDYVCQQVSDGCQKVMLNFNLPVIFGILTTPSVELALARAGGSEGNKGSECVDAALEMINLISQLKKDQKCLHPIV